MASPAEVVVASAAVAEVVASKFIEAHSTLLLKQFHSPREF